MQALRCAWSHDCASSLLLGTRRAMTALACFPTVGTVIVSFCLRLQACRAVAASGGFLLSEEAKIVILYGDLMAPRHRFYSGLNSLEYVMALGSPKVGKSLFCQPSQCQIYPGNYYNLCHAAPHKQNSCACWNNAHLTTLIDMRE